MSLLNLFLFPLVHYFKANGMLRSERKWWSHSPLIFSQFGRQSLCDTGSVNLFAPSLSFQRNFTKLISKSVLILDSHTNDVSFRAIISLHKWRENSCARLSQMQPVSP